MPEFRAWVQAYLFDGLEDEGQLRQLEEAANVAGEREREKARHGERCSECGRPLLSSDALTELLIELDAA